MSLPLPRLSLAFGSIAVAFLLLCTIGDARAETLAAFSFEVDVPGQGSPPSLVADGLLVGNMTLTQDGVTRGPLEYDEGALGQGAVTVGGWSPQGGENFFETVITSPSPGMTFQITDIALAVRSAESAGETLTIRMFPNGEEPISVFSRAGGHILEWRDIDYCQPCFTPLGWSAILARNDLQSLVIQIEFSPVSTGATFGIDEFVLVGEMLTAVSVDGQPPVGSARVLEQNHPNPFNPRTSIPYLLDRSGPVRLHVYDLRGREVRTLVDGFQDAGAHIAAWDGKDGFGEPSASGIYLYRIQTQDGIETRKMTLLQ